MKTLILISALLFSFNILADNESEIIEEGGILYKEFPNQLFDGSLILFHDDGAIKEKLIYKDGLKEGSRETFHKNGQLFEKETYKNGKLESIFQGYYDNGKLWWEGYAIDNLRHGEIKAFNKTGTLKYKGHYRDNLKQGLWKYFDESGEINKKETEFYLKFHREFRKNHDLNSALNINSSLWSEFSVWVFVRKTLFCYN